MKNTKNIKKVVKKRGRPRKKPVENDEAKLLPVIKEEKKKPIKIKRLPKRIKKCPGCNNEVGRKVRTCDCGHKFTFQKLSRFEEIKDWKNIKPGTTIILRKGSKGPYYIGEKGKIPMGYRGQFHIKNVETNGLVGYSQTSGFAFIYMGPNEYIEDTGIYRRRYKLFKKR